MLCFFEHAINGLDDGRFLRHGAEVIVEDCLSDDVQRHATAAVYKTTAMEGQVSAWGGGGGRGVVKGEARAGVFERWVEVSIKAQKHFHFRHCSAEYSGLGKRSERR